MSCAINFNLFVCLHASITAGLGPQSVETHEKSILQQTTSATILSRPALESSRQEESKSAWSSFVKVILTFSFKITFEISNARTSMDQVESDSARQTLVCRGLGPF